MNSAAYDIAVLLQDGGFGAVGANIYASDDQDPNQDSLIMVRETGSFARDSSRQNIEWPTLQITCREPKGQALACVYKIRHIKYYLNTLRRVTVNEVYYAFFSQLNGPNYVGLDTIMRPSYTLNINCEREYDY